jgi:sodium/potassium/calcium exchanger 6
MANEENWDRNRAAILPVTMVLAFLYLNGFLGDDENGGVYLKIGLFCMIPGALFGILIRFKTKKSVPPPKLLTFYGILSFFLSIAWIQFTSSCIMDMLNLIGLVTKLPPSLFGLTILSWGNCLGDMSADVAMTKKGFGEMAISGTMAGTIFNILVGQGLSTTLRILKSSDPLNYKLKVSIFKTNNDG